MKAQNVGDVSSFEFMKGRRVLEINPEHPIIKSLNVRLIATLQNIIPKICVPHLTLMSANTAGCLQD